mmetsp:Transcript_104901/g.273814  ORF Transcript_104901/g.273814 Transcript_104901/m.273814 type:complete len:364 (-) Transcript_104901:114-1205(-)
MPPPPPAQPSTEQTARCTSAARSLGAPGRGYPGGRSCPLQPKIEKKAQTTLANVGPNPSDSCAAPHRDWQRNVCAKTTKKAAPGRDLCREGGRQVRRRSAVPAPRRRRPRAHACSRPCSSAPRGRLAHGRGALLRRARERLPRRVLPAPTKPTAGGDQTGPQKARAAPQGAPRPNSKHKASYSIACTPRAPSGNARLDPWPPRGNTNPGTPLTEARGRCPPPLATLSPEERGTSRRRPLPHRRPRPCASSRRRRRPGRRGRGPTPSSAACATSTGPTGIRQRPQQQRRSPCCSTRCPRAPRPQRARRAAPARPTGRPRLEGCPVPPPAPKQARQTPWPPPGAAEGVLPQLAPACTISTHLSAH